jgi:hypothetical protein
MEAGRFVTHQPLFFVEPTPADFLEMELGKPEAAMGAASGR